MIRTVSAGPSIVPIHSNRLPSFFGNADCKDVSTRVEPPMPLLNSLFQGKKTSFCVARREIEIFYIDTN